MSEDKPFVWYLIWCDGFINRDINHVCRKDQKKDPDFELNFKNEGQNIGFKI